MKKTKFTKLFVLILSLALLIGSAIGIAASADETDTAYSIKSMNIAHGDRTQVLIAVDAVGVDAAEIEVTYTLAGETYVASFYDYVDIYNNDTEYPVFYTKGIPAKDCGQDVLAEAHVAGTTPASPKYMNVSVAGYLYDRLYKAGYISATEGESLEKKNLYLAFVEYISAAEEVLWNYNNPTDQRTLLKDRTYVYAEDAYVAGTTGNAGFVSGLANVSYLGNKANQVGWCVETASGRNVVFGNSVVITESAKLTPYFNDNIIDFTTAELGAGLAVEWVTDAAAGKVTHTKGAALPGGITTTEYANTDIVSGRINTGGTHVVIKEDENGIKYLAVRTLNRTYYTKTTESLGDRSDATGFKIPVTDVDANANVTVWSFDVQLDTSLYNASSVMAQVGFYNEAGNLAMYPYIQASGSSAIAFTNSTKGSANPDTVFATVKSGQLVNIRYEYYFDEGVLQCYVYNVYVGSSSNMYTSTTGSKTDYISYGAGSSSQGDIRFYSMSAINIYKTYVAEPITAPAYETFSGAYYNSHVEWTCNHGTFLGEFAAPDEEAGTAAGKLYGRTDADGVAYGPEYVFQADNRIFVSGLSVDFAVTKKDLAGGTTSGYSNAHGAKADIVTEANGNKYLSLVSPRRVSDRDRAYGAAMKPTVASASHTTYVFEADMRVVGGSFQLIIRNAANKHVQYSSDAKDGYATLGGVAFAKYGEWASVRIVVYTAAEGGPVLELYVKDAKGEYQLLDTPAFSTASGSDLANLTSVANLSFSPDSASSMDVDNVAFYTTDWVYTAK